MRVYKTLLRLGRLLGEQRYPYFTFDTFRVPFGLQIKLGKHVRRSEAETIRYIGEKTSIPVRRVLDVVDLEEGGTLVVMTGVSGSPLGASIDDNMTQSQREILAADLAACFKQLRRLEQPLHLRGHVCSPTGGEFCDPSIIPKEYVSFDSRDRFFEWKFDHVLSTERPRLRTMGKEVHETEYPLVLTHGSIDPFNIIVDDETFRLTAITDWQSCAWLPAYFEYTRSCRKRTDDPVWMELIGNMVVPWPKELAIEEELRTYRSKPHSVGNGGDRGLIPLTY